MYLSIYLSVTLTLSHSPFLFLCLVSNSYPTFFISSFIPYLRFETSFFPFLFLSFPLFFFSLSTGMTGAQIERARAKERGHAVIGDVLLRFVKSCTLPYNFLFYVISFKPFLPLSLSLSLSLSLTFTFSLFLFLSLYLSLPVSLSLSLPLSLSLSLSLSLPFSPSLSFSHSLSLHLSLNTEMTIMTSSKECCTDSLCLSLSLPLHLPVSHSLFLIISVLRER